MPNDSERQSKQLTPDETLRVTEEELHEFIKQRRPDGQNSFIDWDALELKISLPLPYRLREDLLWAVRILVSGLFTAEAMKRFEADQGKDVDRILRKCGSLATQLADLLRDTAC